MQSKEEIILEVFREHSFDAAIFGGSAIVIPEDEWCRVVEQILSLLHPKQDTPPQLNKHDVSGCKELLERELRKNEMIVADAETMMGDKMNAERNVPCTKDCTWAE